MKKLLRDILVIGWLNGWVPLVRSWIWLVANSVTPLSFLIVLAIYAGEAGLRWGLLGGLIWTVASNGISLIGDATFYRLEIKFQQMLVAAPVSPIAYALGLALSSFIFAAPAIAFYAGYLAVLGAFTIMGAAALAISMILLWVSTAGLGFAISTLIKQMRYAWAVPGILSAVLSAMAPVYWPATVLPNELLGVLLPTGAAGIIGQSALGMVRYGAYVIVASWISLVIYAVISLILLAKVARWRQV
ncbi:ABC-2 type transport system, membrane protein [Thermoproteus uzoniensis 768-20]|uniref:ABC-2 type transport system, membrane protein n=1 Tax=Thermoproteus uzoniensis (strain 768-20) TaxID=999630 RepID=F2L237_THEU7|nr:ABC transporter permease [Thermoproteus uzoniensis]AEA12964.1 ABC-2 type transport system, membrane protein [Thermoproteus uzoniensis 768-20]